MQHFLVWIFVTASFMLVNTAVILEPIAKVPFSDGEKENPLMSNYDLWAENSVRPEEFVESEGIHRYANSVRKNQDKIRNRFGKRTGMNLNFGATPLKYRDLNYNVPFHHGINLDMKFPTNFRPQPYSIERTKLDIIIRRIASLVTYYKKK